VGGMQDIDTSATGTGFTLTLKNYRCFPDTSPARIEVREGFTAFVGINNAGKSSILKFFYEFRLLFQHLSNPSGNLIAALRGDEQGLPIQGVMDPQEVYCNANARPMEIAVEVGAPSEPAVAEGVFIPSATRATVQAHRETGTYTVSWEGIALPAQNTNLSVHDMTCFGDGRPIADLSRVGSAFRSIVDMLYIGPFRNAINAGSGSNYFDIQVGQSFVEQWRQWQTGNAKRDNEAAYALTAEIKRIFGFGDLQIVATVGGDTLQLMVDGRSFKLPEVGTGLAQFIIVLANAATRRPSYVLIDEPELSLHPSLQLDFLTTLTAYARRGVLFATHSFGLARATADRIYTVRRQNDGLSAVETLETTPRFSEFLGELGFSSYQDLGFDSLLLVEGPSELKAVQQLLCLYGKDHRVVLLPMGGTQMIAGAATTQLEEIKRITPRITVLIDSERTAAAGPLPSKRQDFVRACAEASISCHVLERRAMENYFPDHAVKSVRGERVRALEAFEALKDLPGAWGKNDNWRITRAMTRPDLVGTDLEALLATL